MFKHAVETLPQYSTYDDDKAPLLEVIFWMGTIWEHLVAHYLYAAGIALMDVALALAFRKHVIDAYYLQYKQSSTASTDITPDSKLIHFSMNKVSWVFFCSAVITYGLLIAGVATQFPYGNVVGLVYIICYGFGGVGGYLILCSRDVSYNPPDADPKESLVEMRPVSRSSDQTEQSNSDNKHEHFPEHLDDTKNHGIAWHYLFRIYYFLIKLTSRPVLWFFLSSYGFAFILLIIWIIANGGTADRNSHNSKFA